MSSAPVRSQSSPATPYHRLPRHPAPSSVRAASPVDAADPDAVALIRLNRHTRRSAIDEYKEYIDIVRDKPTRDMVSYEPASTQCLTSYTIDDITSIIDRNISNLQNGGIRDHRLPTTQTGPMISDVHLAASSCDLLTLAQISLPVNIVGMGFQNLSSILDCTIREPDIHSHHQSRDKPIEFWWTPVGYVWLYGSFKHTPELEYKMMKELDKEKFRREFINNRGQTIRNVAGSPFESGAYIIHQIDLGILLDALRQVPEATGDDKIPSESQLIQDLKKNPAGSGDPRIRHVIRYVYGNGTLKELDSLRPLTELIIRLNQGETDFTPREFATLEHHNLTRKYDALSVDGPPRTVPYGAYIIRQFGGQSFNHGNVQKFQYTESAGAVTIRKSGSSSPGRPENRLDSILAITSATKQSPPTPSSRNKIHAPDTLSLDNLSCMIDNLSLMDGRRSRGDSH